MATTTVANKKPKQQSTGGNTTATTASSNSSFACNTIAHWDGDSESSGRTNGRDSDCNSKIKNELINRQQSTDR